MTFNFSIGAASAPNANDCIGEIDDAAGLLTWNFSSQAAKRAAERKTMQDIKEALRAAMDKGASDVHFSVGRPAMLRIDGKLVPIEEQRLMPADTERLILPVLSKENIAELKEKGEIDLALSVEGIGRFRINVFMSRGSYAAALNGVKALSLRSCPPKNSRGS